MIHNILHDVFADLYELNVKVCHRFHQYRKHTNEHRILLDMPEYGNDDQHWSHFHQFQYQI